MPPVEIMPNYIPSLLAWLKSAAQGIRVMPEGELTYRVTVHNAEGGHEGIGATVATCHTELEAEMVAAGLWALLQKHNMDALPDLEMDTEELLTNRIFRARAMLKMIAPDHITPQGVRMMLKALDEDDD